MLIELLVLCDPVNSLRETHSHSIQTSHPESVGGQLHCTYQAPAHTRQVGPHGLQAKVECACQNLLSKVDTLHAWPGLGNLRLTAHGGSKLPSTTAAQVG